MTHVLCLDLHLHFLPTRRRANLFRTSVHNHVTRSPTHAVFITLQVGRNSQHVQTPLKSCPTSSPLILHRGMYQEQVVDDAVRVVVTPSQASYFAGERFSITITITNTRAPQPTLQAHSASHAQGHSHKRGAHSVSYVPMARPPTSPGIRTALPATPIKPTTTGTVIVRRGIVGKPRPMKGIDDNVEQSEQTRKRLLLNRSQSISVSAHDLRPDNLDDIKGKSPIRSLRVLETPLACACVFYNCPSFFLS